MIALIKTSILDRIFIFTEIGGNVAIEEVTATREFSWIYADSPFGNTTIGVDLMCDFLYKPL